MILELVKKKLEAKDTYTFIFKKPENFKYKPGEYIYITLPKLKYEDSRGSTRPFTISSSPTEKFLSITTRIRSESGFKKTLIELPIGSVVNYRGPFGIIDLSSKKLNSKSLVFLTGGIGITPFRSKIKYDFDKKQHKPIYLVYSNSDEGFVFKEELDLMSSKMNNLKVNYHNSSKLGHIDKVMLEEIVGGWGLEFNDCIFYIVGPTGYVASLEEILTDIGVDNEDIKIEKFTGY